MHPLLKALLAACLLAAAIPAGSAGPAADETALRELKTVLWPRAYFTQDVKLLDRILADEFQSVDDEGSWSTKAEEIAWLARNRPAYDSLTFKIRRLEIFDGDTAIVAGTGTIRGRDQSGEYVGEYQSSNIFIKREGTWRAVASHVSGYRKVP
jgi:hypothetical protein